MTDLTDIRRTFCLEIVRGFFTSGSLLNLANILGKTPIFIWVILPASMSVNLLSYYRDVSDLPEIFPEG